MSQEVTSAEGVKPTDEDRKHGWMLLLALLITPVAFALQAPRVLSFQHYALQDVGSTHQALALIGKGMQPMVDFGYPYGLLNLAVGRAWFATVGAGPWAFFLLLLILNSIAGGALVRAAWAMPDRRYALLVVAAAGTHITASLGLVYAFEVALLTLCISAVVVGRKGEALAWATVCLFVKPSMAYVVGLLITLLIGWDLVRSKSSGLTLGRAFRQVLPSAIILVALVVPLGLMYGWVALGKTLFPIAGMKLYKAYGFGPSWQLLWRQIGDGNWFYIIGSNYIPYVLASICLPGLAVLFGWSFFRVDPNDRRKHTREAGVVCTAAMIVFELKFFGGLHYMPLLALAVLAAVVATPVLLSAKAVRLAVVFVLAATTPCVVADGVRGYIEDRPHAAMYGLWASSAEAAEWESAVAEARRLCPPDRRPLVLTGSGAMGGLTDELAAPSTVYLQPGLALDAEWDRVEAELAAAPVAIHPVKGIFTVYHDRYRPTMNRYETVKPGGYHRVLTNRR